MRGERAGRDDGGPDLAIPGGLRGSEDAGFRTPQAEAARSSRGRDEPVAAGRRGGVAAPETAAAEAVPVPGQDIG
ncbi:hypothetical protein ACWV95_21475 [Streptomyces albus]